MTPRNSRLLDLYTDYLLASFGPTTATGLASLLPDLSHDQITRFLSRQELTDKDLWQAVKPHLRPIQSEEAVLIMDDTVEEKPYTDESELVSWHFDHVTKRTVKGINLYRAMNPEPVKGMDPNEFKKRMGDYQRANSMGGGGGRPAPPGPAGVPANVGAPSSK
jgi:hypothetical protein